jgi:hypothetical protein
MAALPTVAALPAVPAEAIVIALPADNTLKAVAALPAVATLCLVPAAKTVITLSLVATDATVARLELVSRLKRGSRTSSGSRGRFTAWIIARVLFLLAAQAMLVEGSTSLARTPSE